MKIKLALFSTIAFGALSLPSPGFAQSFPTCLSSDSDSDGDGYGWENNATCLVDANTGSNMTGQCEDRGGFPWGWNPISKTSCRLDATSNNSSNVTDSDITVETGICVDTDGDGYGWDGFATCIPDSSAINPPSSTHSQSGECVDPDGDGIGNDGFITCRASKASDPSWEFCALDSSFDAELEHGQAWGSQQSRYNSGNTYNACVRRCGTSAFALSDTPGWSYDPDAGAECIVDENASATFRAAAKVPVYDNKSGTTERQQFEDQFAYPLYYGNASWNCSRQTRASNNEEFTTEGGLTSISFDKSENSLNSFRGNWYFDRRQWRQTLTIDDNSIQDEPFEYTGYAQIEHNTLTVYETSYDRLSCERSGNAPDPNLPTTISEFQKAENLLLNDMLDQTFQCRLLESLGRTENTSSDIGWQVNNIEESSFDTVLTFNPTFLSIDDTGERRYQSTQGYLFSSLGQPLRFSPAFGDLKYRDGRFYDLQSSTSASYSHLLAKRIGDNVILEKHNFSRASGGGADDFSYYVCPVNN